MQLTVRCVCLQELLDAGLTPNSYIFTAVLTALEDGNQWDVAVKVFKAMNAYNVDIGTVPMAGRKVLYAMPGLLSVVPSPVVTAARAAVTTGRAARRWMQQE